MLSGKVMKKAMYGTVMTGGKKSTKINKFTYMLRLKTRLTTKVYKQHYTDRN